MEQMTDKPKSMLVKPSAVQLFTTEISKTQEIGKIEKKYQEQLHLKLD